MNPFDDSYFMKQALNEAEKGLAEGEIPVGAVVVVNNTIIARGHNQTEVLNDFTAHAEMIAITSASNFIGNKYLDQCTLYVTMEPCPMCAAAMKWSRMKKVVFGAYDEKCGASRHQPTLYHPKTEIIGGLEHQKAEILLKEFFANKRD